MMGVRETGMPLGASLETVSRLEVATVHLGLIRIDSGVATGPTQKQLGTYWKDNHLSIQFCLNAYTFGDRGQNEVETFAKDHWVRLVNNLADHRMDYFRLQQESRRIGPIAGRDCVGLFAMREMVGLDFSEGAWSSDARCP